MDKGDKSKIFIEVKDNSKSYTKKELKNMFKKMTKESKRVYADTSSDSCSSSDNNVTTYTNQNAITELEFNTSKLSDLKLNLSNYTTDEATDLLKAYIVEHIWKMQDIVRSIDKKQLVRISSTKYQIVLNTIEYVLGADITTKLSDVIDQAIVRNNYFITHYQ